MVKKYIEINAAEGGDDSKLFVKELSEAYFKMASHFG
jgi:protein subunit release factor A